MRRLIPTACLLMLFFGLSGCGSKKVSITGTVTRSGEKMTWPNDGFLTVVFVPEDRQRDTSTYPAKTDIATSTYSIEGIPTGKYTVAVQQFDLKHMDALGGKYDPGHTTLHYEVTQNGQVIDIDVPVAAAKEGKGPKEPRGKKGGDKDPEKE